MSDVSYSAVIRTPIPESPFIELLFEDNVISEVRFFAEPSQEKLPSTPVHAEMARWFKHYFKNPAASYQGRVASGTPYQQRVWRRLQQIPAGEERSYGELATELASCAQAVAGACRANPIPILIPCHRVVSSSGVGGYMGQTTGKAVAIKQWLLQHESHV